jgi:hypothetical protein
MWLVLEDANLEAKEAVGSKHSVLALELLLTAQRGEAYRIAQMELT